MKSLFLLTAALCVAGSAAATDLDVKIAYYSKVVTAEGVTREARYEETMLRRDGHVWTARVLPSRAEAHEPGSHKHFNHVVLPRHVVLDKNQPRVEYIDAHAKTVVLIPRAEYDNVSFDGSWDHAYYLLDSKRLKSMPLSSRASPVPGARWREREDKGLFERVLWDEQRQVPLVIESGDKAATFLNRTELTIQPGLTSDLPWQKLKGYAQKEYSDYLD
ncbi:hypothetical protein GTP46_05275 [Duganella sp. FT135W]|uniref:Uncharacterized protein n=1 Tax=Duganella flavida TaxID=2692175 RepID=A0A6L8K838_9BURK|nr:hypothetical protein [Duganella flavida]MYM22054.1 hypothetical protein [Duganella flavida]